MLFNLITKYKKNEKKKTIIAVSLIAHVNSSVINYIIYNFPAELDEQNELLVTISYRVYPIVFLNDKVKLEKHCTLAEIVFNSLNNVNVLLL